MACFQRCNCADCIAAIKRQETNLGHALRQKVVRQTTSAKSTVDGIHTVIGHFSSGYEKREKL